MANRALRSSVSVTFPAASARLTVSVTGTAETPDPCASSDSSARRTTASVTSARAPSWISTPSASAGSAARPLATDACRFAPPATTAFTAPPRP